MDNESENRDFNFGVIIHLYRSIQHVCVHTINISASERVDTRATTSRTRGAISDSRLTDLEPADFIIAVTRSITATKSVCSLDILGTE